MDGNHITLGEEIGTEFQVIIEVEGSTSFKALTKACYDRSLLEILSGTPELLVSILRQARSSTATTAVM
tara:strand:- start:600 stop:806 length:207 start_codon:yes stop_codon:yes gene_type:complete